MLRAILPILRSVRNALKDGAIDLAEAREIVSLIIDLFSD